MKKGFKVLFSLALLLIVASFTNVEAKDVIINIYDDTSSSNYMQDYHTIPGVNPENLGTEAEQEASYELDFALYYKKITLLNANDNYYINVPQLFTTEWRGLIVDNQVNAKIKYFTTVGTFDTIDHSSSRDGSIIIIGSNMPELNIDTDSSVYITGVESISNGDINGYKIGITPKAGVDTIKLNNTKLNAVNDLDITTEVAVTDQNDTLRDPNASAKNLETDNSTITSPQLVSKKLTLKNTNMKVGLDSTNLDKDSYAEELVLEGNSVLEAETNHNNTDSIPFYTTITDLSIFKILDSTDTELSAMKDTSNRFVAINSDNSLAKHIFISAKPDDPLTPTVVVDNEECPKTGENTLIYAIVLFGSTCGIIGLRRYKKRLG